jgi:hypothetical protein
VHGYDEFGLIESSSLLGIGQIPNAAEDFAGQTRFLERRASLLPYETTISICPVSMGDHDNNLPLNRPF